MNFYYRKKKNSEYLISGSKLFQFIVTPWNYGEYVLYFQFTITTKYPKCETLQINVWPYIQRGQNSSEIIIKIYCSALTAEEAWEDLTVLLVAASFLGCLGSFWYRVTAQFPRWKRAVKVLCPITQVWLGSILSLLWSVVCVASPALSSACLFKIYCTTGTCKFYDSRDSNLYSPFNENYPSYFFLMEKG